jgi:hypothetical protein
VFINLEDKNEGKYIRVIWEGVIAIICPKIVCIVIKQTKNVPRKKKQQ